MELETRVVDALKTVGPQSTMGLVVLMDEDWEKVDQVCKRLERNKQIYSRLFPQNQRLYSFPVTRQVVHRGNYIFIQKLLNELKTLITRYIDNRLRLVWELKKYFNWLCDQSYLSRYYREIRSFEGQIINDVRAGKSEDKLYERIAMKPFYQEQLLWRI